MDRQQIGVKLTVDGLGLPFKIDGFMDRLIMQKAVYLAQAAGVNLGYFYQWYLHGPYSPSLTRDEFAIAMDISADMDDSRGWKLDDASLHRLEGIKAIFSEPDRDKLARNLELLASVHFLIDRNKVSKIDTSQITTTLIRFNKDFSEKEVEGAIGELIRYDLLAA
jgi:uncharacterized protein YwgA